MSYEGSECLMCRNGHLRIQDVNAFDIADRCMHCGEPLGLVMSINETNGYPVCLPGYFEKIGEDDHPYSCEKCGRPFSQYLAPRYKYVELKWTCYSGGVTFECECGPSATLHGWHDID